MTVLFSQAQGGRILLKRSAEAKAKAEPEPEADSSQYGSPVNSFNAPIAAVGAEYTVSHSPPAFEYHGPEAAESSNVPVVAAALPPSDIYAAASAQVATYSSPSSSVSFGAPFTPSQSSQPGYGSSGQQQQQQQQSYNNGGGQEQCRVERTLTPTGGDCQQGGQVQQHSNQFNGYGNDGFFSHS